jgi:hypothetical protein
VTKLALIPIEGPDKATRMRGGGEWEPIKILYENLAYVPNQNQCACLLARSRDHIAIEELLALKTRLGT